MHVWCHFTCSIPSCGWPKAKGGCDGFVAWHFSKPGKYVWLSQLVPRVICHGYHGVSSHLLRGPLFCFFKQVPSAQEIKCFQMLCAEVFSSSVKTHLEKASIFHPGRRGERGGGESSAASGTFDKGNGIPNPRITTQRISGF